MDTPTLSHAPLNQPRTVNAVQAGAVSGADVLVVIPVLNEALHIEACIRSLMTGDPRLAEACFVVADGGSTDRTREIVTALGAEFPNLRLLANPKKLQSAAVNLAAREAGQGRRILVRCDAHAIYPAGYVMMVAGSLGSRGVASVVVPMDAMGKTCFQKANAWIVDTPLGSGGSAHRGGRRSMFVEHGHHAGFDLKSFLQADGYDETFSHNEDAEFDTRLRKAGGQIFLDADIRLVYLPRATMGSLARQYFNYGKGRARTLMKHGEHPKLRQLIPPATLVACITGLLIAPFNPLGLILPGGYLAALALASLAVAVKHKSACGLLAGAASATMHMSWSAGFFRQMLKGQRG
ncbi:MAG: glycosyltransferase family 2 protein [Hyphomonadaceae bacterium]|nr:glycosyltransferase family 2 protein [Hyphomonadaceae bacterium]